MGDVARTILERVDPKFLNAISSAIDEVVPSNELSWEGIQDCYILAFGKNAYHQFSQFKARFHGEVHDAWILQPKGYYEGSMTDGNVYVVSHPIPDEDTVASSEKVIQSLRRLPNTSTLVVLISGGGSSAFAVPEESLSLQDYQDIVSDAIRVGYNIRQLNLVRACIDRVKGGKLSRILQHLQIKVIISSDVVTDEPNVIASGPFHPWADFDSAVIEWISNLLIERNFAPSTYLQRLQGDISIPPTKFAITRKDLLQSLNLQILKLNLTPIVIDDSFMGDISQLCGLFEQSLSENRRNNVYIVIGEPGIELDGDVIIKGEGGRVSSVCTMMTRVLQDRTNVTFIGLATDGKDGSSPSSGYVVNEDTLNVFQDQFPAEIVKNGNSGRLLFDNDFYFNLTFTNINLMDLYLLVVQ